MSWTDSAGSAFNNSQQSLVRTACTVRSAASPRTCMEECALPVFFRAFMARWPALKCERFAIRLRVSHCGGARGVKMFGPYTGFPGGFNERHAFFQTPLLLWIPFGRGCSGGRLRQHALADGR